MAKAQRSAAAPSTDDEPDATGSVMVDNRTSHIKVFWTRDAGDGKLAPPGREAQGHHRAYRILPGFNAAVPRQVWDLMMDHPGWRRWLEGNEVHVMDKGPTSLREGEALDMIERSASVDGMQRWHKIEQRPPVKAALAKKIVDMNQLATGKKTVLTDASTLEVG